MLSKCSSWHFEYDLLHIRCTTHGIAHGQEIIVFLQCHSGSGRNVNVCLKLEVWKILDLVDTIERLMNTCVHTNHGDPANGTDGYCEFNAFLQNKHNIFHVVYIGKTMWCALGSLLLFSILINCRKCIRNNDVTSNEYCLECFWKCNDIIILYFEDCSSNLATDNVAYWVILLIQLTQFNSILSAIFPAKYENCSIGESPSHRHL